MAGLVDLTVTNKKAPLWSFFVFCLWLPFQAMAEQDCCAVVSAHPLASEAGMQTLRQGGNAFDAAVTVSAVLAVVEPYSSGMGGGGFWLLNRRADNLYIMIDGRERAPLDAEADMYLDAAGEVIPGLSIDGALAAGIPGQPAALVHIAERYGNLPLSVSLQPAIQIAQDGFEVNEYYRKMAGMRLQALRKSPAAAAIFLANSELPPVGALIVQPDLAETLKQIAAKGHDGFYAGPVADKLIAAVRANGGIWQQRDLQEYRVKERLPIRFKYADMHIISAALPSSGGMVLAHILNLLSWFDWQELNVLQRKHLLIEAMRIAYRMRAEYLGDRDYVRVPYSELMDRVQLKRKARAISLEAATPSVKAPVADYPEGRDTTHFSIIDTEGNKVSATLSINYPFGSGFVAAGTGVLLNDEMDDFSAKPGVANVYGLVGSRANAIEGGKRMLSSMTPTFIETDDFEAVIGTPGGSRIISMVLLGILNMQDSDDPQQWVDAARFHHQYLPDRVEYESGAFSKEELQQLQLMGHELQLKADGYGNMQALRRDRKTGKIRAGSDKRGFGAAVID